MREKNNQLKEELATKDGFIDNLKSQLREKENAITTLQTQLVNCENQLQQALEPISPPVVVVSENENPATEPETPTPEEPIGTTESEPETPVTEPITENTVFEPEETEPDATEALQTEAQPKLLNPKQLAQWINENCNPEKEIKDHNIRDWYTPRKTCEKTRLENEQKYGHKLDHKDKKGTLWFTVG